MSIIARIETGELKQLFHIENSKGESGQQILSLRFGKKYGSFSISGKTGAALYELAYCSVSCRDENELIDFFSNFPSLQNSFYQVQVAYDFSESIFIPSGVYDAESAGALLNITGGDTTTANVVSELIPGWQLYNVYAVPKELQQWITNRLPAARFWHQYSLGIKHISVTEYNSSMLIDIQKDNFTVLVAGNKKILLAQTFDYTTPEDVLYYLLKTAERFSLPQQEVSLQLSGLIDKQSALYKELYQYFINIEFRNAEWGVQGEYPAHFFTSLNDLAKCAS